jgi:CBS domain-containing protein
MTSQTVEAVMSSPVLTVAPDDSAAEAANTMRDAGANSVVIVDQEHHPVGILTSTDYVVMTSDAINPHQTPVDAFATTDLVTARPDETVESAAKVMTTHNISHLPVVDEDDQAVGIVTTTDLAEHLASRSEE